MRRFVLFPLAITSMLLLSACQGASVPSSTSDDALASAASEASQPSVPFSGERTEIDLSQSSITFVGGSSIVDHPGRFTSFTASITPDSQAPSDVTKARVTVAIDIASVKTDAQGLDGHLQREDFFNAAQYPQATFVSTSISQRGEAYTITGDLSIKGVTKSITADAMISDDGITTSFDLPRKEFGIGNDSYGDKLLDTTVPVTVTLMFR